VVVFGPIVNWARVPLSTSHCLKRFQVGWDSLTDN
jgi:hypothetical protein